MNRKHLVTSLILAGSSLLAGCGNVPLTGSGDLVNGAALQHDTETAQVAFSTGDSDSNASARYEVQATTGTTSPAIAWVTPRAVAGGVSYHTYTSVAARSQVSYHIYRPTAYTQFPTRRFPVLYWLHGSDSVVQGIPQVASFFDAAIRSGKIPPMLIVFPNGLAHGQYVNSKDGKQPIETMITRELLPLVDRSFRTIATRQGRIVEGFSMGGYGAARLGFRYPDLFGAVSMDAAGTLDLDFSGPRATANPEERDEILRTAYGNDMAYYRACSPITITALNAAALRGKQRVRQVVGDRDFVLSQNVAFHGHLDRLGIRHEFRTIAGVDHNCAKLLGGLGEAFWGFYRDAVR
jgi:enterochelin esterase-like enzyme